MSDNYPAPQYELEVDDDLWLTNDGRRLRVEEMTDLHVRNARAFMLQQQIEASEMVTNGYCDCEFGYAGGAPPGECEDHDTVARTTLWMNRFDFELARRATLGIRIAVRDGDS